MLCHSLGKYSLSTGPDSLKPLERKRVLSRSKSPARLPQVAPWRALRATFLVGGAIQHLAGERASEHKEGLCQERERTQLVGDKLKELGGERLCGEQVCCVHIVD